MGIGAAAAAIGAVASVGSGLLNSHAASSAAQTQADAANRAADIAHQQYLQTRADLAPYNVTGQSAINQLSMMYGLGGTPGGAGTSTGAGASGGGATGAATGTGGAGAAGGAAASGAAAGGAAGASGSGSAYHIVSGTQWVPVGGEGGGTQQVGTYDVVDSQGNVIDTFGTDSPNAIQQIQSKYPGAIAPLPQAQTLAQSFNGGGLGGGAASAPQAAAAGPQPMSEQQFLENTPGYQFALSQGLKSVQSGNIARGISGAALKGAAAYATGLADNTYQTNLLQPLQYLGTLGENAAAQTGTIGSGLAQAQAQSITGAGNVLAAGQVGSANALSSGFNGVGNAAQNYLLYNKLNTNTNYDGTGADGGPSTITGNSY